MYETKPSTLLSAKHMHSVEGKEDKCQESVAIERKAEKVELQLVSYFQFIIYKF